MHALAQQQPAVLRYQCLTYAAHHLAIDNVKCPTPAGRSYAIGRNDADSAAGEGAPESAPALPSRTVILDGITFSADPARPDPSFCITPLEAVDDPRLQEALEELGYVCAGGTCMCVTG